MADRSPAEPVHHKAQDVRGGEIILRTRWRRIVFVAGLILAVLVTILFRLGR